MKNSIYVHRYEDGYNAVIVEFGTGSIGIGLGSEKTKGLPIHLQELNELKKIGEFLTEEERLKNFEYPKNPIEVILYFPNEESVDNFIDTLKIYKNSMKKEATDVNK